MRRGRDGFTLMELLVVIALIVAVVALAVPNFSAMMKGRKLDTAATLVQSAILQARSLAASGHIQRSVEFCPHVDVNGQDMIRVEYEYEYIRGEVAYDARQDDNRVDEGEPIRLPVGVKFDFTNPDCPRDHDPMQIRRLMTDPQMSEYSNVNSGPDGLVGTADDLNPPQYEYRKNGLVQDGFPDIVINPDGTLIEAFNPVIVLRDTQGYQVKLLVLRNTGQVVKLRE